MSQRAMPFILINMTGEMSYILEQRLIAQQVQKVRCKQVLSDILRVLFNEKFLNALFEPQEQYSQASLRQYVEKMAHSSVMRLNEPRRSMDRLFDMLTMAVKQQVLSVSEPNQLLQVTLNHLIGIREIASHDDEVITNVKYAHELLVEKYKDTETWEFAIIRSALLNHFQDLRIRVSQLMRLGLQMEDGRFVLFKSPIEIPNGAIPPGTIRYFENGEVNKVVNFVMGENYVVNPNKGTLDLEDMKNRCTKLGENIFKEDQQALAQEKNKKKKSISGVEESKLLSKLINRAQPDNDNFTLSLFDNDEFDDTARPETSEKKARSKSRGGNDSSVKVKVNKTKSLAGAMQEMDIKPKSSQKSTSSTKKTRGEELLKLMDDDETPPPKSTQKVPRSRSGSRKAVRNQSAVARK